MKRVPELAHVRRDDPQVLGEERQRAQCFLYHAEEVGARARHPLAGLRRRRPGRYVPRRRESSEVIQTDRVDVSQQGAQAVDAPAVAARGKRVPVIDRIAPALSLRAEVVRRHTGDDARPALGIEQEQLRVGPHVARVRRDEEGQVADQAHAFRTRVGLQARPLTGQQELSKSNLLDLAR